MHPVARVYERRKIGARKPRLHHREIHTETSFRISRITFSPLRKLSSSTLRISSSLYGSIMRDC